MSEESNSMRPRGGRLRPLEGQPRPPKRWLVDGFNVLHTAVLRGRERGTWWEADARAQLLERVRGFDENLAALWIIFDGPRPAEQADDESGGPFVVFAPSADEWLLKEVRQSDVPDSLVVVTADRKLADKARHHGAQIVSPRAFLARCPQVETAS